MKDRPSRTEDEIAARRELVALAESMLSGQLSFVEGARRVSLLRVRIGLLSDRDEDVDAFVVIDSETDQLPLQAERDLWSASALARLEPEIKRAEDWASTFAPEACRNLIARFRAG